LRVPKPSAAVAAQQNHAYVVDITPLNLNIALQHIFVTFSADKLIITNL
jgi:hypothetical protein